MTLGYIQGVSKRALQRNISGVTFATAAVIRVRSSTTFAGKGGTNT